MLQSRSRPVWRFLDLIERSTRTVRWAWGKSGLKSCFCLQNNCRSCPRPVFLLCGPRLHDTAVFCSSKADPYTIYSSSPTKQCSLLCIQGRSILSLYIYSAAPTRHCSCEINVAPGPQDNAVMNYIYMSPWPWLAGVFSASFDVCGLEGSISPPGSQQVTSPVNVSW